MARLPKKAAALDALTEEGEEAELWIVSYADMVTLLFGFFVILYSFSTLDESKFNEMSKELAESFHAQKGKLDSQESASLDDKERQIRAFQMLVSMMNLGDDAAEAVTKIEEAAAKSSDQEAVKKLATNRLSINQDEIKDALKVQVGEENFLELIIPDTTLFPAGGSELSPDARTKLQGLVRDLREVATLAEIEVVGHTDGDLPKPGSPNLNNFALSSLRAGTVAQALIEFGLDPTRISTRGMGALRPLAPEVDEKGQKITENMAKNRRVHIVLKTKGQHESPTSDPSHR